MNTEYEMNIEYAKEYIEEWADELGFKVQEIIYDGRYWIVTVRDIDGIVQDMALDVYSMDDAIDEVSNGLINTMNEEIGVWFYEEGGQYLDTLGFAEELLEKKDGNEIDFFMYDATPYYFDNFIIYEVDYP